MEMSVKEEKKPRTVKAKEESAPAPQVIQIQRLERLEATDIPPTSSSACPTCHG